MSLTLSSDPIQALGSSFEVTRLAPFGIRLTAKQGLRIETISPASLDHLALIEKLVVIRGLSPVERDEFLAYCRSFPGRTLLEWNFGPVMEMMEKPEVKNYLFSREAVPYHWDGAFHKVPIYLMFYCVEAPVEGAGGETLFCDTGSVLASASAAERAAFEKIQLTYETTKVAHYGGKVTGPLMQTHPRSGREILRYAEPVETELNPVTLTIEGLPPEDHTAFVASMKQKIYSEDHCYAHTWVEGDVLMADNHALIHGRRAFELDCPRHLRRIQLV